MFVLGSQFSCWQATVTAYRENMTAWLHHSILMAGMTLHCFPETVVWNDRELIQIGAGDAKES